MNSIETESIDVVLLCGGKGERLKSAVNDRPKVLAEINGRAFLDILIDYIANFGFKHFILCTGYKSDLIKSYYKDKLRNLRISFSQELKPLGTAGAIKNAKSLIKSPTFLVLNGDSLCKLDLVEFIKFHIERKALFSAVLLKSEQAADYGIVSIGDSDRILKFDEKVDTGEGCFISAGIYLFDNRIFSMIPSDKNFSLERQLFPKITKSDFYGYKTDADFIDIGTPERYRQAQKILK
ncbi:MAG: NTP transferase domain-containing protein [Candidatus Omnitrophica bacterium]|nr:NTP transferase domain-containing protein [Candidatus Omnitrophota bacterium]